MTTLTPTTTPGVQSGPVSPDSMVLGETFFFDRLQAALGNLYGLDPQASLRALSNPQSLSPEERRKLSDRLGMKEDSFLGSLVDISTHPLVLAGVALTLLTRIPSASRFVAARETAEQIARSLVPVMEKFQPVRYFMRDVKGGSYFTDMLEEGINGRYTPFTVEQQERIVKAFQRYTETAGVRNITPEVDRKLAAYLDGLQKADNPVWKRLRSNLEESIEKGWVDRDTARQVLQALDKPMKDVKLTRPEQQLADDLRDIYQDIYTKVLGDVENKREILRAMGRQVGVKNIDQMTDEQVEALISRVDDYLPHIPKYSFSQRQEAIQEGFKRELERYGLGASDKARRDATQIARQTGGGRTRQRAGALLPDADDFEAVGGDPRIVQYLRFLKNQTDDAGRALDPLPGYQLSVDETLPTYIDAMGRVYAFTVPTAKGVEPLGKRLMNMAARNRNNPGTRHKWNIVENVIFPLSMGRMTQGQLKMSSLWEDTKHSLVEALKHPKVQKAVPEGMRNWMTQSLTSRNSSYPVLGQTISDYLHTTTIGGNAVSASLNLLQNVATLIPTIGMKDTVIGFRQFMKGFNRFVESYTSGLRLSGQQRVARAWPEFHNAHLELDPLYRDELARVLSTIGEGTLSRIGQAGQSGWAKVKAMLMGPFSATEYFNRIIAFYGSRAKALRELPGTRAMNPITNAEEVIPRAGKGLEYWANKWARENTSRVAFGTGLLNRPVLTADWASPIAQYTTFPLRMLGFFTGEAIDNPGIMGRALLGAGLAYGAGREFLDADLSRGLMFGGLPVPEQDGAFAPFPLVSPALQMVGSAGFALTGDTEPLRRSLPLLFPGGISAARGVGLIPGLQGVSEFIGRGYVDYENVSMDETGRPHYAYYNSSGALQGYFSGPELLGRSIGFNSVTGRQEQELTRAILGNRERIREMKREALQALYEGDAAAVMDISEQYQQAFPRMGPLPIDQQDLQALHRRQNVARLERLLETVPSDMKPLFSSMVSTTLGAQGPGLFGLMGGLDTGRTILEREPYRAVPQSQVEAQAGPTLHGVKLSEKMRAAGIEQGHQARRNYFNQSEFLGGF